MATGKIVQDPPDPIYIYPETAGKTENCGLEPGENVSKGQKICTIITSDGKVDVVSTVSGTVLSFPLPQGSSVDKITSLHTIADLTQLDAIFDIYEKDLGSVYRGQKVVVSASAFPGKVFDGKVNFISPAVDESTRTVKVRVKINNVNNVLKLGMYITGGFVLQSGKSSVVIPQDAAQFSEGKRIAFVKTGDDSFELRNLEVTGESADEIEVISGLKPYEQVVVSGGFLLKSEFFKSKMGAGCAD